MKALSLVITSIFMAGCSVVGQSNVESAPYTLLKADEEKNIEIRNYDAMILVSTSMNDGGDNSAFRKLFKYITGANEGSREIAMTAPVIMDKDSDSQSGAEIAMTAPVFMNENADTPMMSFVMPKDFTMETTPKPTNPDVIVTEIKDHKVAAIKFSGTLRDGNVEKHTKLLQEWMVENNYIASGKPVKAGYNGPLTLPMMRHNEVLIEIQ
jgi:hypothetical protein